MAKELPQLREELARVNTQQELDVLYNKYIDIMTAAYNPKGRHRNRKRFKYFWNDSLNFKARVRSRLYSRAKITGLPQDQQAYKQYARMLKREIKKAKREKKASGVDMIFNEAMKLDADASSDFLTALWARCGQIS